MLRSNRTSVPTIVSILLGLASAAVILENDDLLADDVATEIRHVTSADVFDRMAQVHDELEVIRKFMGRPSINQPGPVVHQAGPREVYYQALDLLRHANQLCFDHTREREQLRVKPNVPINNADVLAVVDMTLNQLQRVKRHYGMERVARRSVASSNATSTDLFQSVVDADREINLMLDRRVSPSNVFEQVTYAIGYAARLMEQTPQGHTMPATPEFEPNKKPADVYRRLLKCLDRIHGVAARHGLHVLKLEASERHIHDAEPNDVLHLASLVVSELAYLHSQFPDAEAPRDVYYVGRKFPSHVYQRVGILERQLEQIATYADANPRWLRPKDRQ